MAAVQVVAETAAARETAVLVMAVLVTVVPVMAAKAAVQVMAAVRVIPVVINPAAVIKAVPQSHQRNSLL